MFNLKKTLQKSAPNGQASTPRGQSSGTLEAGKFTALAAISAIALGAALSIQAPAAAQSSSSATDMFNLPDDISMLAETDPNNRKATARVNGNIITGTDIDHRVALTLDANGGKVSPEEMQGLRLQTLRNLIDETLQVQEATAQEMPVDAAEVDGSYARLAEGRFQLTPKEMDDYLTAIGSSSGSLKRQIQGELAWNRLTRRNISPFVNVSAGEVNELLAQLKASRGTVEYRIGEIFLSSNPTTREQVMTNASSIVEQLKQGGSFVAYARQYSEASTAATGGDLGWIQLPQLQNAILEEVAASLSPGQLAGPIDIPGGFSIMLLIDKRSIGMADPRDAILSLKQISLTFPAGTSTETAQARATAFAAGVLEMNGCGDANAKAAALGAETVDNDGIAVRALPDALQASILDLNIGQATPPFGSLEEGVRVLMLCGRDDPTSQAGPSFDQLMSQIEDERVNKRAQRYLRDLRRDAVIEYN